MTAPTDSTLLRGEAGYPAPLAACHDAPRVLYARGRIPDGRAVAVVGSRAATREGREIAAALARALAGERIGVVSGGALGIDAAAHRGALDAGGATVAVLGTPLDQLYPPQNRELLASLPARGGALVTPFAPGTPTRGWRFVKRNRVVAGLAEAVVVVEAGARSGALATARAARDYGRGVLAVPRGAGATRLLAEGARAVETPADLLAALAGSPPRARGADAPVDATEARLLAALGGEPRTIDELAADAALPVARVATALFGLELRGRALRRAGGYVRGMA